MNLASVDGTIGPAAEARIPASDEGLLRGDGIFEVMRLYAGRPYALGAHLARFGTSAGNLRLDVDVEVVHAELHALLEAAGPVDALLRVVATRGGHRVLFVEPLPRHLPAIRLGYVTYAPPRILNGVKSLSYAANMQATRLAKARGADEAVLVTPDGTVLEAPTSSLFWVSPQGALRTTALDAGILDSITRTRVIAALHVEEGHWPVADLRAASEAFLASTTRDIQAVSALDGKRFAEAPGPRTREAVEAFEATVRAELDS